MRPCEVDMDNGVAKECRFLAYNRGSAKKSVALGIPAEDAPFETQQRIVRCGCVHSFSWLLPKDCHD